MNGRAASSARHYSHPMAEHPATGGHRTHRSGGYALAFGLLAIACALIPVIGDLVAVPIAVVAVVCGVVGVGHYDAGRAPRMLPALAGAILGAVALLLVVVGLIATSPLG